MCNAIQRVASTEEGRRYLEGKVADYIDVEHPAEFNDNTIREMILYLDANVSTSLFGHE